MPSKARRSSAATALLRAEKIGTRVRRIAPSEKMPKTDMTYLSCVPIGQDQCRVNYHCGFGLPAGWRGMVARLLMRRELNSGPVDSLSRLRRAAEERYARQLA